MKAFLILVLITTASAISMAGTTIVKARTVSGSKNPGISIGFTDSSFDYSGSEEPSLVSMCYIGQAEGICDQVKAFASDQYRFYLGAHEYFNLISCETDKAITTVVYKIDGDYDAKQFHVRREIKACEKSY